MKKNLLYILLFVGAGMTLSSCSEDKLSEESVIKPEVTSQTPFDSLTILISCGATTTRKPT